MDIEALAREDLVKEMLIGRYGRKSAANEIHDTAESYIVTREVEDLREIAAHLLSEYSITPKEQDNG